MTSNSSILSSRRIILAISANWNIWLSFIRNKAQLNDVWKKINLELINCLSCLLLSVESISYILISSEIFKQKLYNLWKIHDRLYLRALSNYDRQQKIIDFKHESISTAYSFIIRRESFHLWNILRILKHHLASSNVVMTYELKLKYHKLNKNLENRDVKSWIEKWHETMIDVMKYEVVEMTRSRSIKDFLITVNSKFLMFFSNYRMTINRNRQNSELSKVLKQFRLFIRQERFFRNEQSTFIHEVFATISESSNQLKKKKRPANSTFNEKSSSS